MPLTKSDTASRNALYIVEIKETFISIVKALNNNLIANIIQQRKTQDIVTKINGIRHRCPLFTPLFNTVLEVLSRAEREGAKGDRYS